MMTDLPSLGPLQGDDKITLLCYTRFRFVFKFCATCDARKRKNSKRSSILIQSHSFIAEISRKSPKVFYGKASPYQANPGNDNNFRHPNEYR